MEEAMFMINPEDVKNNAVARGVSPEALEVPEFVILTFNRPIIGELTRLCNLKNWEWEASKYTPYSTPHTCLKGEFDEIGLAIFVPPMGASPIAAFCEELIVYGARNIFLLCASWSLGDRYLEKGQIHVPSFAIGLDGTSYHYGNTKFRIDAEPSTHSLLIEALKTGDANWKQGGVGCCEAFYRITHAMVDDYRKSGCLSIENGEVAVLYSLASLRKIHVGVLLQPYIDLERGLDLSYIDSRYPETCKVQAHIALKVLKKLYKLQANDTMTQ
jgi:uridine phosphorylase